MSFIFFPLNFDADLEAEGLADLISTFFPSAFSGPLIDSFKGFDRFPFGGNFERAGAVKLSAVFNADFNAVFNGALLLSLEALPIVLGTLSQKRISVNTQKWV